MYSNSMANSSLLRLVSCGHPVPDQHLPGDSRGLPAVVRRQERLPGGGRAQPGHLLRQRKGPDDDQRDGRQ